MGFLDATIAFPSPSWVILGVRWNGQYMVIASADLTLAEIIPEFADDIHDPFLLLRQNYVPQRLTYRVNTRMTRLRMATGKSWLEAMAKLFGEWDFDGEKDGLPAAPPAELLPTNKEH